MSKIKNEDLGEGKDTIKKLSAEELEQVKGGSENCGKSNEIDDYSLKPSVLKTPIAPTSIKKRTSR